MNREELYKILDAADWETLVAPANLNRGLMRNLMNRIYVKDGLQFWRAIEALGIAAREIDKNEAGYAVESVRRYFWALNDESGGTAWNATNAIGSLIAHNPKSCGHFNWMLSGLLEDESLQEGALWGLAQIAIAEPSLVVPLAERVLPFLSAQDPQLRGLAAWNYALMQNHVLNNMAWRIPEDQRQALLADTAEVEIYWAGELRKVTVANLAQFQTVHFWSESLKSEGLT